MTLRIAFTFLCLTAAEPCSEFDPFCAAKGHELLQRQTLLKMETENLMSYEEFEASVKDSYATGLKRLKRSKLLVEKDFGSFHHSAYRVFVKDESCMENVRQGVHHFGKTTGLVDELNSTELEALMARVTEEMEIFCKHDHIENITDPDVQSAQFMKDFVKALTHEAPLMTSRLMEQLVANSEGNYTFDFPDWLLNFSMLDLHDRTGREIENTSHGLLLMQTQSYTEKMKRRSLPATFDSRTAWPACGEVIGRIHNQGTWAAYMFSLDSHPYAIDSSPFVSTPLLLESFTFSHSSSWLYSFYRFSLFCQEQIDFPNPVDSPPRQPGRNLWQLLGFWIFERSGQPSLHRHRRSLQWTKGPTQPWLCHQLQQARRR